MYARIFGGLSWIFKEGGKGNATILDNELPTNLQPTKKINICYTDTSHKINMGTQKWKLRWCLLKRLIFRFHC